MFRLFVPPIHLAIMRSFCIGYAIICSLIAFLKPPLATAGEIFCNELLSLSTISQAERSVDPEDSDLLTKLVSKFEVPSDLGKAEKNESLKTVSLIKNYLLEKGMTPTERALFRNFLQEEGIIEWDPHSSSAAQWPGAVIQLGGNIRKHDSSRHSVFMTLKHELSHHFFLKTTNRNYFYDRPEGIFTTIVEEIEANRMALEGTWEEAYQETLEWGYLDGMPSALQRFPELRRSVEKMSVTEKIALIRARSLREQVIVAEVSARIKAQFGNRSRAILESWKSSTEHFDPDTIDRTRYTLREEDEVDILAQLKNVIQDFGRAR